MRKSIVRNAFRGFGLVVMLTTAWQAQAQDSKPSYPTMAPLDQYLMEQDTEVALARSAAPPSIADDAKVMVFGKHGYEIAVEGKNGFVCMVQRSWTAPSDDPEFWNPKLRAPICFSPAGARSYLPLIIKRTDLVLAGRPKSQIFEAISSAIDKKELPNLEPGAMAYMLSKDQYLGDGAKHWHPHLMFFFPSMDPASSGAGLPGSPLLGQKDEDDRLTVFFVPVRMWSDGTPDLPQTH